MDRNTVLRIGKSGLVLLALAFLLSTLPATAQDASQEPTQVESSTSSVATPTFNQVELLSAPPILSQETLLQLEQAQAHTELSPTVDTSYDSQVAGPVPGTESTLNQALPDTAPELAPGDAMLYSLSDLSADIPGNESNYLSPSTDGKGITMFYVGNFFAANSLDKGHNWRYINPFLDFPNFCCGQQALYDQSHDMYLWLRTGNYDANGENVFKLSVSLGKPFTGAYWTYTTAPTNVNGSWVNQFWDAPRLQLGAEFLYLTWNLFNQSFNWTNTVVLRWPLEALYKGEGFSFNYVAQADWFTFMPVAGANHTMYFASNWDASAPYDSLRIWRWHEDSGGLTYWTKTVPAWTAGTKHCGTPNWLNRGDFRLQSGARYEINNDGIAESRQTGRSILGWWWNVGEGSGFTYPYINAAAFYEDTMDLLPGFLGRPYIYGGWCFAYPSFTPNHRGDLGGIFQYSATPDLHKPVVAYAIADEYVTAPPGWPVYTVLYSNAGPSDTQWGNQNTTRTYQSGNTWLAGSFYIPGSSNCANCAHPLWFSFGRARDEADFRNTCQVFGTCAAPILKP